MASAGAEEKLMPEGVAMPVAEESVVEAEAEVVVGLF